MRHSIHRRSASVWLVASVVLALAGCAGRVSSSSSVPLTTGELRLVLTDQLGPLWYCDRDSYPVGRDEQQAAIDSYADMAADAQVFPAVAAKLGMDPRANLTDAQKLALYRLWKTATAISINPIANDRYRFDYLAQPVGGAAQGIRTAGTIDTHGAVTIEQQALADGPMCPICLSKGTMIDAPAGAIAVERLRIGDTIWTLDGAGRRVAGAVIAVGSTPAPAGHQVIHVTLADGRSVTASPGHPLADGRRLADLRAGDVVAGSTVATLETLPYAAARTYDLVVSGDTGIYLAAGIPLRSTLD
jgi:hypothetical protein